MRLPMPRLQDGSPHSGAEELEETETHPLTRVLAKLVEEGDMKYMETRDGITHYQMLKPVVLE